MSHDQLKSAIEAIRVRLQAELDAQMEALGHQQQEAIETARRQADADAHERWAIQLEQVRADWASRLETELAAAAADADRRTVAECTRARLETEQAAAEQIAAVKQQASVELETARGEIEQARADADRLRRELQTARAESETIQKDAAGARGEIETLRAELAAARAQDDRIRGELENARAELEPLRGQLERTRAEAEQARADADEVRKALDKAVAGERDRAQSALAAAQARIEALERERADESTRTSGLESELAGIRTRFDLERGGLLASLQAERERMGRLSGELLDARQALERERQAAATRAVSAPQDMPAVTDARVSERQSQLAIVERLLASVQAIGLAQSLSDALAALVATVGAEVPRVALFIVRDGQLQTFKFSGFNETIASAKIPLDAKGVLQQAIAGGAPVSVTSSSSPGFAELPADRAGLVVPISVGGRAVAALYCDDASAGDPTVPAAWPEAVQILCEHASAALAHITALRTAQAIRLHNRKSAPGRSGGGAARDDRRSNAGATASQTDAATDDDQAAQRYARLLVSEIKLYNETAVRLGREKRDLLARLQPELERARRLYEERVPANVSARAAYFRQEVIQTLAGGDPTLLGNTAVPS
jgi:chromosome segregation ATPase